MISNKYNKLIDDMPIFAIHYIPLKAINGNLNLSVSEIKRTMTETKASAFGMGYYKSITVDGVMMQYNENGKSAYAIYKNNGIIEKASTIFFYKDYEIKGMSPKRSINMIFGALIIRKLIEDLNEIKEFYSRLDISSPIIICCAFLNAFDYTIPTIDWYDVIGKIDRDILCINNLYVEDITLPSEEILKPILDSIWNSCGHEQCNAYRDGQYIGPC